MSAIDPVFIVVTRWGRRMVVFAKKELFEINAFLTVSYTHLMQPVMVARWGIDPATKANQITREQKRELVRCV